MKKKNISKKLEVMYKSQDKDVTAFKEGGRHNPIPIEVSAISDINRGADSLTNLGWEGINSRPVKEIILVIDLIEPGIHHACFVDGMCMKVKYGGCLSYPAFWKPI